MNYIYLE